MNERGTENAVKVDAPGELTIEAEADRYKQVSQAYWGGMTSTELYLRYRSLHRMGVLQQCHYMVAFRPFDENGLLFKIRKRVPLVDFDNRGQLMGWLASEVDLSAMSAETDSVKAGGFTHNFLNGLGGGEFSMTLLETSRADVQDSAKKIKALMVNSNGTQNLPRDYLIQVDVAQFHPERGGASKPVLVSSMVAMLTEANTSLSASGREALQVQMTFTKAVPFLPVLDDPFLRNP